MKFLITSSFKALRSGSFVEANSENGEFILDTESKDIPAIATLKEIAKANKISLKEEKKSVMLENLETGLNKLKLPEQNKMSDENKAKEIISAGVAAGKSDDEMKIELVMAGIKFKAAGKMFKDIMESEGHRISNKDRKEEITAILEESEFGAGEENITYDEYAAMINRITEGTVGEDEDGEEVELPAVADTTEVQARKIIAKFAKENEIELPKLPKAPKGGLRARLFKALVASPEMTDDELKAWLLENVKDNDQETADKFYKKFQPVVEFAQAVRAA